MQRNNPTKRKLKLTRADEYDAEDDDDDVEEDDSDREDHDPESSDGDNSSQENHPEGDDTETAYDRVVKAADDMTRSEVEQLLLRVGSGDATPDDIPPGVYPLIKV